MLRGPLIHFCLLHTLNTRARLVATLSNAFKQFRDFHKFSCSNSTSIPDSEQLFLFTQNQRTCVRFFSMPHHDNCHTQHVFIQNIQFLPTAVHDVQRCINLLKTTGHVMHQQFNIQQLYVLHTLYLCVLYLSENKQRLVPLTA
jgi:hypothetical protein